jgi:hypothetical protein
MRARLGTSACLGGDRWGAAWLFWKVPMREVWAAITHAAPWTVPVVMGTVVLVYLADSFAMWRTFGWFLAKLPFRDVMIVRGATYLLAAINYSVGQGAIVYFVHRARGVPIMRGVATVLLIMGPMCWSYWRWSGRAVAGRAASACPGPVVLTACAGRACTSW